MLTFKELSHKRSRSVDCWTVVVVVEARKGITTRRANEQQSDNCQLIKRDSMQMTLGDTVIKSEINTDISTGRFLGAIQQWMVVVVVCQSWMLKVVHSVCLPDSVSLYILCCLAQMAIRIKVTSS